MTTDKAIQFLAVLANLKEDFIQQLRECSFYTSENNLPFFGKCSLLAAIKCGH